MFGCAAGFCFGGVRHQPCGSRSAVSARAARSMTADCSPGPSSQTRLGSLRNQINCRRATGDSPRDERTRGGLVAQPVQQLDCLPVDEPAERSCASGTPRASRARISSISPRSNWTSTRRHAGRCQRRRNAQPDGHHLAEVGWRGRFREVGRQRTTREEVDLQRAHEPLAIARQDARARRWIDALHHAVRKATPRRSDTPSSLARSAGSAPGPGTGPRVNAGSRARSRPPPAAHGGDPGSPGSRAWHLRVAGRRVDLGRLGYVDQMVRNPATLRHRHLVRADIEPAVDRGRIAVDDLSPEPLR